jgi:hypothetical protein
MIRFAFGTSYRTHCEGNEQQGVPASSFYGSEMSSFRGFEAPTLQVIHSIEDEENLYILVMPLRRWRNSMKRNDLPKENYEFEMADYPRKPPCPNSLSFPSK